MYFRSVTGKCPLLAFTFLDHYNIQHYNCIILSLILADYNNDPLLHELMKMTDKQKVAETLRATINSSNEVRSMTGCYVALQCLG